MTISQGKKARKRNVNMLFVCNLNLNRNGIVAADLREIALFWNKNDYIEFEFTRLHLILLMIITC